MLLSKPQLSKFWRSWSAVCKQNHWGPLEAELQRHALLHRVGFDSLTKVDKTAGFDRLLAELGRVTDDVARTAESDDSDPGYRRRLLWLINRDASTRGGLPYVWSIARDKFGLTAGVHDLDDLATHQLHDLMITLHARRRKPTPEPILSANPF